MSFVIPGPGSSSGGPSSAFVPITSGTIRVHASGNGASNTTALNAGVIGQVVQIETQGEVYIKFGVAGVAVALNDFHIHMRYGDYRTVRIGAAQTHVAIWGVTAVYSVVMWRTDGT